MNVYAIVVLATLAVRFVVGLITEILNLKALRGELPQEFAGLHDTEAHRKSQDYTRAQTRFGFVTSSFDLAVTLVFWLSGGFNLLSLHNLSNLTPHPLYVFFNYSHPPVLKRIEALRQLPRVNIISGRRLPA